MRERLRIIKPATSKQLVLVASIYLPNGSIVRNGQFRLYGSALSAFIYSRSDYNLAPTLLLRKIECRIGGQRV